MIRFITCAMVFLGSLLMIYNIYGFVRFAREIKNKKGWDENNRILYIPIILLIFFLLGYIAVGIFGNPDLIVSGILFGGSIFVFVIYELLTNITKRVSESERLEAQLMAAEQSSRAKSEFLESMSHEMRTPMNVIIGLDTVALSEPDLSPQTRHRLEKIGESAKYLLGLINNILDLNSSGADKIKIKKEPFSLSDAVRQVNAMVSVLCAEKGLSYSFDAPEEIDGEYIGDETVIKQVLFAMLDNAVKYTDSGEVKLLLDCTKETDNIRSIRFTVSDTGIGMEQEFLQHVFEVFAREDQSETGMGGSGLGLAVAKRHIEEMGGTITVKSEKNKGSVFAFTLPLEYIETEDAPQPVEDEEVTLEGRRILIVEDVPENAEIVADLLELEEAETEHAENGKIAVDMFNASPPGYYDAVLMDLRMPVMDGFTATREIRALDRADAARVPIIALSANAFETDINRSLAAGMNAHLAKPADADQLYSTIKKFIALSRV